MTSRSAPELKYAVGVVTAANKYHAVPYAKVIHARNYEHSAWRVLLEVLVLNCETVVLEGLQFIRLHIAHIPRRH